MKAEANQLASTIVTAVDGHLAVLEEMPISPRSVKRRRQQQRVDEWVNYMMVHNVDPEVPMIDGRRSERVVKAFRWAQDLLNVDLSILALLSGPGGFLTCDVARLVDSPHKRWRGVHTQLVRERLEYLRSIGKVAPMDDRKPICWEKKEQAA